MINIALKTEYSFKRCFGKVKDLVDQCEEFAIGIADEDNTFGHIPLKKACESKGIKPIFGVRLRVPPDEKQRSCNSYWIFIARNNDGLKEIYRLVNKAYDQFHYFPRLHLSDISLISDDVIVIRPSISQPMTKYEILAEKRVNFKMKTPYDTMNSDKYCVAIQDNFYINEEDAEVYELLAGASKRGENDYVYNFEQRVVPMHIVSEYFFDSTEISAANMIARACTADIEKAGMVKFKGHEKSIKQLCIEGAQRLNVPFTDEYIERLETELNLIKEKGYEDYFLIVADMLNYANEHMLVGPSRGSSAGSLVCYLLNITKIDPLKFGLIFERFIDVNRFDLPDIDIDFPDTKRELVIKYLHDKYGENNVKSLANINTLKAKSAIDLFGMGLGIPKEDCENVKNAMIERSAGDARNAMCISDTFNDTEPGKEFIEKYPKMNLVSRIENHAQFAGKHAAGIIVSNKPLTEYGGINSREDIIMMDKRDAEFINLLKIDCLGLTTLSILEEAAELCGMNKDDYYKLPLDDEDALEIFRKGRLNGIFQFEGQALKMLNKSIQVDHFDDIVAITALARPGALRSGGAAKFAKRKNGESEVEYFGSKHKEITEATYGIMVYQEQMMQLAKEIANFSWMEISDLRRAASKSLGDDYFSRYEDKFINGCIEHSSMDEEDSLILWRDIQHAGSWIFNKSHAVSYGLLSYLTAYMKAHQPLEFLAACLNNSKDEDTALRILRDGYENDEIEYIPVDPDLSDIKWTVKDGKLLGGLTNIKGIGEKKAEQIISARKGKRKYSPFMLKLLENPKTKFDILFPTQHLWGNFFVNPTKYGLIGKPTHIKDIDQPGDYFVIGRLISRNLNDLNEYNKVEKRGYKLDEHTLYLNIILEDDHDSIMCSIGRYDYERLNGRIIAEEANVNEDWFLVKGKMTGSWRGISVQEIINLTEWSKNQ